MDDASDYKELLGKPTVNLRSARDVELWTETLDIYTADLVLAVGEVGDSAGEVFRYLQGKGIPGSRSRTPWPRTRPGPEEPNS